MKVAGVDNGAFTTHRCHGFTNDINPDTKNALTMTKATII